MKNSYLLIIIHLFVSHIYCILEKIVVQFLLLTWANTLDFIHADFLVHFNLIL